MVALYSRLSTQKYQKYALDKWISFDRIEESYATKN